MNETALTKYEAPDIMTLGAVIAKSGYFQDARDAGQAVVKVLAGQELGLGPIASMTGIYIVKGRVTLSANLIAAIIKRSGRYNYHIKRLDNTGCEIVFTEMGKAIGTSSFTDDDAKAAGLAGDNWNKYRRNMHFARAMSNGAKWYTPDVFAGPIYTPEELGATVDGETGEIVDGKAHPVTPASQPAQADAPAAATTTVRSRPPAKPSEEMTDEEIVEWFTDAPVEAPAPAPAPVANGNGKRIATVKTPKWQKSIAPFASAYPHYQKPDGSPDPHHMLASAVKCGFSEVTDDNLAVVLDALRSRAEKAQAAA